MAVLADITKGGRKAEAHRPWPRFTVGSEAWRRAVNALVEARATLLSLWGDKEQVHLALLEEPSADIVVVTLELSRRQVSLSRGSRTHRPSDSNAPFATCTA